MRTVAVAIRERHGNKTVLAYRRPMPDPADDLTPRICARASPTTLTSDGRLAKTQSAELMASIVAERLIARLERDGFVILRRPGLGGHSALGRGFEPRSA